MSRRRDTGIVFPKFHGLLPFVEEEEEWRGEGRGFNGEGGGEEDEVYHTSISSVSKI